MELLFDTANLAEIEALCAIYPVAGITSNPTIIKAEGKIDFYAHFQGVRQLIGTDRTLHVQVLATTTKGIIGDAKLLLDGIDGGVLVKIPTTEPGLAAMRQLKADGVRVTATAVYSKAQGMMAILAGADYIAPYFNRMEAIGVDAASTINSLVRFAERAGTGSKVMPASFKNIAQVCASIDAGVPAITVPPRLIRDALGTADVLGAVQGFVTDWQLTFGTCELPPVT